MAGRVPVLGLLLVLASCGGRTFLPLGPGEDAGDAGDAAEEPEASDDAGDAGGIPRPGSGHQVDVAFDDVEPNDTPNQATPLGVAENADVPVWVNDNAIGGPGNPADYFVFESAPSAGSLEFNMCFTGQVTGLTATLWKVAGGAEQEPPIGTWTLDDSCAANYSAPLEASTEYLLGVLATGGPGNYEA